MGLPTPANRMNWVQRPLAVGVGLHELAPTPGIPVGCVAAALTQTVGKLTVNLLVPMVTMTLSVMAVDGHIDTVDYCIW
jgi:hypothetical protein